MSERVRSLKSAKRCLLHPDPSPIEGISHPQAPIHYDHAVAKYIADIHPSIFISTDDGRHRVRDNRFNIYPFCWPDHCRVEERKREAFISRGVSGLICFLGNTDGRGYPLSPDEVMQIVQRYQLSRLFEMIASNINILNGEAPVYCKDDYLRAYNHCLALADRYQTPSTSLPLVST